MQPDENPTPDQLRAMAYADGELAAAERASFEERLAGDRELRLEVARYQELALLASHSAPPEPADWEWAALALDPWQRSSQSLGWIAVVVGVMGLAGLSVLEVLRSDMQLVPKVLVLAVVCGFALLLLATVRARLRTLPYDRYTKVER